MVSGEKRKEETVALDCIEKKRRVQVEGVWKSK